MSEVQVDCKDFIMVMNNVFTPQECDGIIDFFEAEYAKGISVTRQTAESSPKHDKNDVSWTTGYYKGDGVPDSHGSRSFVYGLSPVFEHMYKRLDDALTYYANEYDILMKANKPNQSSYLKLQRTEVGGGYHIWHYENSGAELSNRFLVWTIYLNDVADGGETEFLYQHKRVPAKQGSLCLFPAGFTHTHRGNPPLSNTKYIATGWFEYAHSGLFTPQS